MLEVGKKIFETEEILESLNEGVIALDREAKVTFANLVACKMLGVSCEKIVGQFLEQIGSDELILECGELVLKVLQNGKPTAKTWIYGNRGRTILDLIAIPLMQQNGAILVLQDKTSDYKIVQMGKDFIANASHELRTPITIIRGFAEMLPELREEMQREVTEKIVRTCGRLEKLVKSLLILSDMENFSEETFRSCDLLALAETCKHQLLAAYPKAQVTISSKRKYSIIADPDLLELALMNLLENAVRYSQEPAQIQISIQRIKNHVFLNVADRGIGIPESDLPHIFDRFYTVDKARSRKSGGTGLGLSIVKTIVEKHKGETKVSSRLRKGSTFSLVFQIEKSQQN